MIEYIPCGKDGTRMEITAEDRKKATLAYLSQVVDIHHSTNLKRSKIKILRDSLSLQSPQLTDMPKNLSPPVSSMEEKLIRIMALEQEVDEDEEQEAVLKAGILDKIGKMEDMQEQMVLIGCFLSLKPLGQVANEMYLAESWVWKIRRKAVGSMETVLEQEGELQKWIRKQKRWI